MKKTFILLILLALAVSACLPAAQQPAPTETPTPQDRLYEGTDGYPWWNDAVFYEIFVRSFYDSDGDGIGDFNGIIQKLDYLNDGDPNTTSDLGVTGIWLMPIFPSPSYHGYDVTDYYTVNPQYGSLDDFKRLVEAAHQRGIHVIIDLVINHTSDQHPWFRAARDDPNSPYHDWYIWSDEDPGYTGPWGEEVWHPDYKNGYYYGVFTAQMPDLNYNNPAVTAEMENVSRFWLEDIGVDGFRLDAAKHLIEDGRRQENTPETHAWFSQFRDFYKSVAPQALTVGEIYGSNAATVNAYTGGDQLDLVFHFTLAQAFVQAAQNGSALPVLGELNTADRALSNWQFATFITNHDQDRVMSQLEGSTLKAKVAAALLLTSPGVPFIYYGEEIGMMGSKPDENIRRPMQWSSAPQAGFTSGTPWRAPDGNYKFVNVDFESGQPDSLLNFYRQLIHLRAAHPALRVGSFDIIKTGSTQLAASLRVSQTEAILTLINTSASPNDEYYLKVKESPLSAGVYTLTSLNSDLPAQTITVDADGAFNWQTPPALNGYQTLIWQIQAAE